jgi:hypothetical protein
MVTSIQIVGDILESNGQVSSRERCIDLYAMKLKIIPNFLVVIVV